jgi:hypothetical protein
MEAKPWYASKTLWFAVLFGLVNVAGALGYQTYQPDAQTTEIVGIVVSVVAVILRLLTKQPVG